MQLLESSAAQQQYLSSRQSQYSIIFSPFSQKNLSIDRFLIKMLEMYLSILKAFVSSNKVIYKCKFFTFDYTLIE